MTGLTPHQKETRKNKTLVERRDRPVDSEVDASTVDSWSALVAAVVVVVVVVAAVAAVVAVVAAAAVAVIQAAAAVLVDSTYPSAVVAVVSPVQACLAPPLSNIYMI